MTIQGRCHCGNISFELETALGDEDVRPRSCDCSFCSMHGAKTWSDPEGHATIRVADARALARYRFGLEVTDFLVCRTCGAYAGAVTLADDGTWATLNLRLTRFRDVDASGAHYGGESADERNARRRRMWTPTAIVGSE